MRRTLTTAIGCPACREIAMDWAVRGTGTGTGTGIAAIAILQRCSGRSTPARLPRMATRRASRGRTIATLQPLPVLLLAEDLEAAVVVVLALCSEIRCLVYRLDGRVTLLLKAARHHPLTRRTAWRGKGRL